MPIAQSVTYKCRECNYTFTKTQSDTFIPKIKCPKCGGELEIVKMSKNPLSIPSFLDIFDKIFKKNV